MINILSIHIPHSHAVSDFSPASMSVQFSAGQASQSFRVSITDDDVAEPALETFVLLVDEDTGNCALPVVIADDDGMEIACCE